MCSEAKRSTSRLGNCRLDRDLPLLPIDDDEDDAPYACGADSGIGPGHTPLSDAGDTSVASDEPHEGDAASGWEDGGHESWDGRPHEYWDVSLPGYTGGLEMLDDDEGGGL